MNSLLQLKPTTIIGDLGEYSLTLDSWKGFQSRQGNYTSKDTDLPSDGKIKVIIRGVAVDYVKLYSQSQASAIKYLIDNQTKVRDTLLTSLLNEYPKMKEIYEDNIPNISDINDYKDLIGLSTLHVLDSEKDDIAYLGFEFGCNWDEEHGTGVVMHKDRIISIGQATEAFNLWVTYDDNGTASEMEKKWNDENKVVNKPWWKFW